MKIQLCPSEVRRYQKPVSGQVGFRTLLPSIARQWRDTTPLWLLIIAAILCLPMRTEAQSMAEVYVGAALSAQDGDNTYVGSQYLDKALGGFGAGFLVGGDVVRGRWLLAAEYSNTNIEQLQTGRLVPSGDPRPGTTGRSVGHLRDGVLSGYLGRRLKTGVTTFDAIVGLGAVVTEPTYDGVDLDGYGMHTAPSLAPSGGFTVASRLVRRMALMGMGRLYLVNRNVQAQQLGIGSVVFRVGGAVRVDF